MICPLSRAGVPPVIVALAVGLASVSPAAEGASSTATGISRAFNPALSVNTLLLGQVSRDDTAAAANGFDLQELELQFTSVVDPFWTADLVLAVHPEKAHAGEEVVGDEHAHGSTYALDVEVATVRCRNLPRGLGLALGKFYLPFGKHLPLHTHQQPFVRAPSSLTAFTGDHGLTEVGVEFSATVPLPWWSDLQLYGVDGRSAIFAAASRDLGFGARWSNLWDLNVETTLEVGGSVLAGPGPHHGDEPAVDQRLYGADLTVKWISGSRSHGPALTWTSEVLLPRAEMRLGDPLGFYSILQYRARRNWWIGLGGGIARDAPAEPDQAESDGEGEEHATVRDLAEWKANLTWTPSEFSSVRGEISYLEDRDGGFRDLRGAVQVNFTIGSHPAHLY